MLILEEPISFYIKKMQRNEYFSLAGFSDAEWFCLLGQRNDCKTGLGQTLSSEVGKDIAKIFRKWIYDPSFMFATPKVIKDISGIGEEAIERFLGPRQITFYERDMVTDDLARKAKLFPFIEQLKKMRVVIVSNEALRGLTFLNYDYFVEISIPDHHLSNEKMAKTVDECLDYGRPAVYLFSAGISACLMIDKLHGKLPNSYLIDCGSIWDAFVGIGEQREWRAKLYDDNEKYKEWVRQNLQGK